MKKQIILFTLVIMSLNCFSQNGQDSTKIQLSRPVAEVVAQGLIRYDGLILENRELQKQIDLFIKKVGVKDKEIFALESKIINLDNIVFKTEEQYKLEKQKSEELIKELKKQKTATVLYKLGTLVGITATTLILLQ